LTTVATTFTFITVAVRPRPVKKAETAEDRILKPPPRIRMRKYSLSSACTSGSCPASRNSGSARKAKGRISTEAASDR